MYKVLIVDINKKGYLLIKHSKSKKISLEEQKYLVDKVKLVINKKGELVLLST